MQRTEFGMEFGKGRLRSDMSDAFRAFVYLNRTVNTPLHYSTREAGGSILYDGHSACSSPWIPRHQDVKCDHVYYGFLRPSPARARSPSLYGPMFYCRGLLSHLVVVFTYSCSCIQAAESDTGPLARNRFLTILPIHCSRQTTVFPIQPYE